ncbi:ABC transporter permease [Alkalihalobacillus trypoxylicola]|uniref:ABC-2 type transporter transmembrane domain-containing protein n=1 Tax=Alkalihalobacillus trypoxylicola TaxID=519424 RepID=A0A162CXM9_9BACI|nr:ABC transporter permease [Alkalihalobacillus trypoxylicola]KYG27053.1 hypothetical protein AZF04_12020 [Alkalihalobacillus trypoxylicola]
MLLGLIKKDLKLFLYDRIELLILIAMPLLLITILGFSLGNFQFNKNLDLTIAYIEEETLEDALVEYEYLLMKKGLEEQDIQTIMEAASSFTIPEMIQNVLEKHFEGVTFEKVDLVEDKEAYNGVVLIEEGYRQETWNSILFHEGDIPVLSISINEQNAFELEVVKGIFEGIMEEINLAFSERTDAVNEAANSRFVNEGEHLKEEIVLSERLISSFDYYSVGMAVMFVLYGSAFISNYTLAEKRSHILSRLMITNVPMYLYISTKWLSSSIISFLQLSLVFIFCYLAYDVVWDNIWFFLLVTACLCLMIGGITSVLSMASFVANSYQLTNLFNSFFVAILAIFGGSFGSLYSFSPVIAELGRFTPNGAAMNGYFLAMTGGDFTDFYHLVFLTSVFCFGCIVLTYFIFKNRGDAK